MVSRKKGWLVVGILATFLLAGLVYWISQTWPILPTQKPQAEIPADLGLKFEDIKVVQRSQGKLEWELAAQSVQVSKDRQITNLSGLKKGVYYRDGQPELNITAQRVRLNSQTKNMVVEGEVMVSDNRGMVLRTPTVKWIAAEQKLVCPQPVQAQLGSTQFKADKLYYLARERKLICPAEVELTTGDNRLTGDKLVAHSDSEEVEISGNVRMKVKVDEIDKLFSQELPLPKLGTSKKEPSSPPTEKPGTQGAGR